MDQPDTGASAACFHPEAHLQAATRAANVALWSICPATGQTWFSATWYTILGYAPDAFSPSFERFIEMMHPDDRAPTTAAYLDLVEGRSPSYAADFRLRSASGDWRWIGATGSKVTGSGDQPDLVYGMQMDITARKTTEDALAESAASAEEHRQRLARLAENSPAALFEFRLDAAGEISMPYITAGVHEILAVSAEEVEADGVSVFRNIFEEDQEKIGPTIERSRAELSPFRMRYRVKRPDKPAGFIWVQANSMPHREADGSTVWFGSIYDVSPEVERENMLAEAHDAMRRLALQDGLTGLPNRRRFDELLAERAVSLDSAMPKAVLIRIDLDRFKYVNDTLGHAAGDAVLQHIADILRRAVHAGDVACRVGGDEFCVLLAQGRTVADGADLVRMIQTQLETPFEFEGKICRFGASFGIASTDHGAIENGDLMSFSDAALYEAKAAGRGRLEIFDKTLHEAILDGRRMASELEAAIERQEFVPYFQPQICARSGRLTGAEVLARWCPPDGSVIPPDRFMPVAEQIRAVHLIDMLMVERVIATVDDWAQIGFHVPKLSFNVSAGRLRDPGIVAGVKRLQDRGVKVAFELLESILLEEDDGVMRVNVDLARDAGIEIEVDDFGTGHASILGLLQVDPDVLKIDRRLTANVVEAAQSRELVASIMGIARSLQLRTVAEGVETEEQAAILRDLGCEVFQGYLYASPRDAAGFHAWAVAQGHTQPNGARRA